MGKSNGVRWENARLGTHGDNRARWRADKDESFLFELLRELGVLAEESVSRVNSLR